MLISSLRETRIYKAERSVRMERPGTSYLICINFLMRGRPITHGESLGDAERAKAESGNQLKPSLRAPGPRFVRPEDRLREAISSPKAPFRPFATLSDTKKR